MLSLTAISRRSPNCIATAVSTRCVFPDSSSSMRAASARSVGLPSSTPSTHTAVSAARTGRDRILRSSTRVHPAHALARHTLRTKSSIDSPGITVSSTSGPRGARSRNQKWLEFHSDLPQQFAAPWTARSKVDLESKSVHGIQAPVMTVTPDDTGDSEEWKLRGRAARRGAPGRGHAGASSPTAA